MHSNKPIRVGISRRAGFTLTELVVAASLMTGLMAVVAPLTVRSGRLWQQARRHQLAIDELSNQLELLVALQPQQRKRAIADLAPSQQLLDLLPGSTMSAELVADANGARLVLSLHYGTQLQPKPLPVTLVGWLDPLPRKNTKESP